MMLLALDPSQQMGFCLGKHDGTPIYGTHRLPKGRFSRQALALEAMLLDMIKANRVERVYAEKPILPRVTSFDAMIAMAGKATVIGLTCARIGVDLVYVDMSTWRSEFGVPTQAPKRVPKPERRKWVKAATIERCRALGYEPGDDNAADAIGIWWSRAAAIREREASPTLFESDILAGMDV
ncbi:hypothetical protein [Mangrovibrevibacter kandeliae]|uniref:hypothetical protein n=1 Tax=Mangrovibrevibacter kandeliae TaxID=2968473 RepID=UPI002117EDB4|nr:hypothetical protein [Aurantimonas sp. CSK15Z-1]MCQ8781678.1 hypothetical protein [Aurantimonas sp. CSK15Z-1]